MINDLNVVIDLFYDGRKILASDRLWLGSTAFRNFCGQLKG